jgi:hypothetical protein
VRPSALGAAEKAPETLGLVVLLCSSLEVIKMQSESIEKMEAERQQVGAATHIRTPGRRNRGRRLSLVTVQLIDELEIATMEHLSGLKDELESELDRGVLFGLDVEEPKVQVRCRLDSRP